MKWCANEKKIVPELGRGRLSPHSSRTLPHTFLFLHINYVPFVILPFGYNYSYYLRAWKILV